MSAEKRQERSTNHFGGIVCLLLVAVYFGQRGDLADSGEMFGTNHFKGPEDLVPPTVAEQVRTDSTFRRNNTSEELIPGFTTPSSGKKSQPK